MFEVQVDPDRLDRHQPGLDVEKLTYFAMSVMWRAQVHSTNPFEMTFADAEPVRRYFMGETGLPDGYLVEFWVLDIAPLGQLQDSDKFLMAAAYDHVNPFISATQKGPPVSFIRVSLVILGWCFRIYFAASANFAKVTSIVPRGAVGIAPLRWLEEVTQVGDYINRVAPPDKVKPPRQKPTRPST